MANLDLKLSQPAAQPAARRSPRLLNRAALLLAALWVALLGSTLTADADDYKYFVQGAINLSVTGDPLIPPPGQERTALASYYNPPILAYLMRPLTLLSYRDGQLAWFGLNALATFAFAWLGFRLSGSELARRYWGVALLCFLVAPPTRLNLQLGQISIFTGLPLLVGASLSQRRPAVAGLGLAVASLFRIFPALLGLRLLLRRRWPAALWTGIWGLAIVVASILIYGLAPYQTFVRLMLLEGKPLSYPYAAEHNISLMGMAARLLATTPYSARPALEAPWLIGPLVALGSLAVVGVCIWRDRGEEQLGVGIWICAMMLVSPTNGYYMLVLALVPLLAAVRRLELAPNRRATLLLALCALLILVPPTWTEIHPALYLFAHTGWGLLILTPSFYGLLGLGALLAWLAGKNALEPPLAPQP